jgi:serine/threonine protein kinase
VDVDRLVGTHVAGYAIESVLGRGAMGVVYVARQRSPERRVALKVINPAYADDEAFRERFLREARSAAAIEHPHILPVYGAGEADGTLYIAMRLVDGRDLRAILHDEGSLAPERVATIVSQIGSALDAAHARGLVHRDVKPGNVLVTQSDGEDFCYLTDFGISTWTSGTAPTITATGRIVGTLHYASPEQIEGSRVGPAADVYALGCVAYECLTGTPPFAGREATGILYAHVHERPAPPSSRRPGVPPSVDAVLERALAKRPEDRYGSGRELSRDLRAAVEGSAEADTIASRGASNATDRPRPRGRGRAIAAVAASFAVLVAAVAVVALANRPDAGGGPPPSITPSSAPRIREGVQVVASHTAPSRPDASGNLVSYNPMNVIDGNVQTAWEVAGDGRGETVTLLFDNPVDIARIGLIPGYAKTDPLSGANRFDQERVIRKVRYLIDGVAPIAQTFERAPVPQFVDVNETTDKVVVQIVGTSEPGGGPHFDFTAISEIYVYGYSQ